MDSLAILYGTRHRNGQEAQLPLSEWAAECFSLARTGRFHIAFFNYHDFIRGADLKVGVQNIPPILQSVSRISSEGPTLRQKPLKRNNPTLLRCPYLGEEHYEKLEHDLLRFGYRLVISNSTAHVYDKNIAADILFEKDICRTAFKNQPMTWRVFFFDGTPFYKSPIAAGANEHEDIMPEPPEEAISAFAAALPGLFGTFDLAGKENGRWECSHITNGQFVGLPAKANSEEFASAFAGAVANTPRLPDWNWCLTAYVKDENELGEDHRIVHGTRHFAPGTKVWLHPPNYWDGRAGAIGIPRYSNKLTRVILDTKKLKGFRAEKVYNKEILTALAYSYEPWPFCRFAPVMAGGGNWGPQETSRERILKTIEQLNSPG